MRAHSRTHTYALPHLSWREQLARAGERASGARADKGRLEGSKEADGGSAAGAGDTIQFDQRRCTKRCKLSTVECSSLLGRVEEGWDAYHGFMQLREVRRPLA